jgi:hypothetical protein
MRLNKIVESINVNINEADVSKVKEERKNSNEHEAKEELKEEEAEEEEKQQEEEKQAKVEQEENDQHKFFMPSRTPNRGFRRIIHRNK